MSLDLMKSPDPATNLQETKRKEEDTELHHEYAISKIQPGKFCSGTALGAKDKKCLAKKRMEEESLHQSHKNLSKIFKWARLNLCLRIHIWIIKLQKSHK